MAYLLPQMQGAGVALRSVTGSPVAAGAALVAAVVVLNVIAGGMRSITLVQAFQYWLKVTAIATPVLFLVIAWHSDGAPDPSAPGPPVARETTVATLTDPVDVVAAPATTIGVVGTVDGRPYAGPLELDDGERARLGAGTEVTIAAGTPVPHADTVVVSDGPSWAAPLSGAGGREHPLYATYSLVLALLFGTMGLPHVLVRFYTNPDGRAARRTTAIVIGLLGLFYLWPPVYGALGRVYAADLLLTGRTDTVVLELPGRLLPAPWGELTSALLVAGAFAAFLSTSSGLVVSVAGVISRDLLGGVASRRDWHAVALFRSGAVVAVLVPLALSLVATSTSLAGTVGLAFAVAASTFCPLLLLGIWWRGLTAPGALWGLAVGGSTSSAAVLLTIVGAPVDGVLAVMLQQPAAWTMPIAFGVMVLVSRLTRDRVPADVGRVMVRLHTPEAVRVERRERGAGAATSGPRNAPTESQRGPREARPSVRAQRAIRPVAWRDADPQHPVVGGVRPRGQLLGGVPAAAPRARGLGRQHRPLLQPHRVRLVARAAARAGGDRGGRGGHRGARGAADVRRRPVRVPGRRGRG